MKSLREGDATGLLTIKRGSGQGSKTSGIEDEIIAETERNNYHTRQQIADMIQEKFHVQVSVWTVVRLHQSLRPFINSSLVKVLWNHRLP